SFGTCRLRYRTAACAGWRPSLGGFASGISIAPCITEAGNFILSKAISLQQQTRKPKDKTGVCGIIGSVHHGDCLDESISLCMRDSLAHRGPDDAGLWLSQADGVTLGSRRLAILDLSPRGHQPMQSSSGDLVVVFNGEIYNSVELRQELQKTYAFRSQTDT